MEEGLEEGTSLLQIFDWSIQSRVSDAFTRAIPRWIYYRFIGWKNNADIVGRLRRPRKSGWLKKLRTAFAGNRVAYACDRRAKATRSLRTCEDNSLPIATVQENRAGVATTWDNLVPSLSPDLNKIVLQINNKWEYKKIMSELLQYEITLYPRYLWICIKLYCKSITSGNTRESCWSCYNMS